MSGRLAYLSEAWFDEARQRVGGVLQERPGLSCAMQWEAERTGGPLRWVLVIADGRIVEWRLGDLGDAEVEIRLDLGLAWRALRGEADGNEALGGCTVVEHREGQIWTGSPAPLDLGEAAALGDLPHIPGANLDVQYEYSGGPFGPVSYAISITDGQVEEMFLGRQAEPDVTAHATFLQMAQVRRGDITVIDALVEGVTVQGPEGALAMLAGVSESPEFRRAETGCGRSGMALGVFGAVWSAPACQQAFAALADDTGPADGI